MRSARTECPTCSGTDVIDLRHILSSRGFEYFRCRLCDAYWMVPTGQDQPATRILLGKLGVAAARDQSQPFAPPYRACPKCSSRADLLDSLSQFARVVYYRCSQCFHVWIHEADNPNSSPVDITIPEGDNKAS